MLQPARAHAIGEFIKKTDLTWGISIAQAHTFLFKERSKRMRTIALTALTAAVLLLPVSSLSAAPIDFEVFAMGNSSSGGAALATVPLLAGDHLVVSAALDDCWSAGAADRETNADGLVGNTTNACRPSAPTNYGLWTQLGVSFPYASLVGQIGSATPFLIGTSFDGIVADSGLLTLMFWDSNSFDNFGSIIASVQVNPAAVPEPATALLSALGVLALARRRVRKTA